MFFGTIKIEEDRLCATSQDASDSCEGDSGGPLVVQKANKDNYTKGLYKYNPSCKKIPTI